MSGTSSTREAPLEAIRGIACLVVVFWHVSLGFFPWLGGIFAGFDPRASVNGKPWFALLNGPASVAVFFVLSGFVLTRSSLLHADPGRIARGAAKRWPRLAGPVVAVVMASWLLFATGAYQFQQAGAITHSPWLKAFAFGISTPETFSPSPFDAALQGTFWTFFRGDSSYDSSLWTMKFEFYGSFIAFALALALVGLRNRNLVIRATLTVLVAIAVSRIDAWYVPIVAGVGLALLLPERPPRTSDLTAFVLLAVAFLLLGYSDGRGRYHLIGDWVGGLSRAPYVHTPAAIILIVVVETNPRLRDWLSRAWARILGRLSFPIYLLHVPVLCSAGCAAFLLSQAALPGLAPRFVAGAVTIAVTFLAAAPLAIADVWWTRWLARAVAGWRSSGRRLALDGLGSGPAGPA